jgi:hypothetical protein
LQDVFFVTLRSYERIQEFHVVAAVNNDEDSPPNYTVGPGSLACHFRADCERITERELRGEPDLQRTWFALLAGEPTDPKLAATVVQRCGTAYLEAGLHRYFEPTIKRRRDEPRAAA